MSRDAFEEVLGAMARAGLVRLSDAVFEKDGKQIPYRKVSLTRAADAVDQQTPVEITMKDLVPSSATRRGKKRSAPRAKRERAKRADKVVRQKPVSSAQQLDRIPVLKWRCESGEWPRPDDAESRRSASSMTRH